MKYVFKGPLLGSPEIPLGEVMRVMLLVVWPRPHPRSLYAVHMAAPPELEEDAADEDEPEELDDELLEDALAAELPEELPPEVLPPLDPPDDDADELDCEPDELDELDDALPDDAVDPPEDS